MGTEVRPLISLSLICLVVLVTTGMGLLGIRRMKMDLPQLVVGGRSLGKVLLWLLMAGENYTSYTFLGAAGWAYSRGICTFYVFASFTITCVLSYFIFPPHLLEVMATIRSMVNSQVMGLCCYTD